MSCTKTLMIASMFCLFAGSASADATNASLIKNLPNGSQVVINGTVEDFDNQHSFMLRDATGTVEIDLSATKSVILKNGDKVSIAGNINHTILGTDIVATAVKEDRTVGEKVGDAIDSVTGQNSSSSARLVTINHLPDAGLVKVNGTVDDVDSEKKFTLKDRTGHVDVTIKSDQSASLKKGTGVTVYGSVDKGMLGKSIQATEVDVRSDDVPVATQ